MGQERSHYDLLSSQVLEKMFRLLSFEHKLRCEVVCKGWRDLLRCPPSGIWGDTLHVRAFVCADTSSKIALDCTDVAEPIVDISARGNDQAEATNSFVRWLARRGAGVSILRLTYSDTGPSWLFAQLLYAVHLAAQSANETFDLHLSAGDQRSFNFCMSMSLCSSHGHALWIFESAWAPVFSKALPLDTLVLAHCRAAIGAGVC